MKLTAIFASLVVVMLLSQANAQELPGKIRGYKVYNNNFKVANFADRKAENDDIDVFVRLGKPKIVEIGLSGVVLEVGNEITAMKQSGQVEFLTFHDFRINGIAIDAKEYNYPFLFKKGEMISLPNPTRVTVSISSIPLAAYNELIAKSDDFAITGTVFVFGKFKKFGFSFKRVVPLMIDLKIKNPMR